MLNDDAAAAAKNGLYMTQLIKLLTDLYWPFPELATDLLAHKRRQFLRSLYDDRTMDTDAKARYFVMLGVAGRGDETAMQVHEFLANGGHQISWDYIWSAVTHYIRAFNQVSQASSSSLSSLSEVIRSDDVLLLRSLLWVVEQVVAHSVVAKFALYGAQQG